VHVTPHSVPAVHTGSNFLWQISFCRAFAPRYTFCESEVEIRNFPPAIPSDSAVAGSPATALRRDSELTEEREVYPTYDRWGNGLPETWYFMFSVCRRPNDLAAVDVHTTEGLEKFVFIAGKCQLYTSQISKRSEFPNCHIPTLLSLVPSLYDLKCQH
jgi:hypothetical protein